MSVPPGLTLGILGTPLEALFPRLQKLGMSLGAMLRQRLLMSLGATTEMLEMFPCAEMMPMRLAMSRHTLWLLAMSSTLQFVVLLWCVSALRTLLFL